MTSASSIAALAAWARRRTDIVERVVAVLLFALSFNLLTDAHNHQVGDSRYTLVLSQNLISHGEFALDRYNLVAPPAPDDGPRTTDYRLYRARGRVYYFFPVGSSILSIPYVVATRLLGGRPVIRADGRYDGAREEEMQVRLAAWLMAALSVLIFFLARLLLPMVDSALTALVMTFGTQVYSTASRALWSETWGILLVGLIVYELLRARVRGRAPRGIWLASLACWSYFARPTNVLALVAIAGLLALENRGALARFLATAAIWLAGFVAYSESQFGTLLPAYYLGGRIGFRTFLASLTGCLFSPGRGLFIYVPVVLLIGFLVARYWRHLRHRALAQAAIFVCAAHTLMLSGFLHWWGGHCFGARLYTGLVPWFALLAVLGLDGARAARAAPAASAAPRPYLLGIVGGLLCAASVVINEQGATSHATSMWNAIPADVDAVPARLWSWREPQFLAGLRPAPHPFAVIPAGGVAMGEAAGDRFVGKNWGNGEGTFRWTDGAFATVKFARGAAHAGRIEIVLRPYLPPAIPSQRVQVSLNGHTLANLVLTAPPFQPYLFPYAEDWLQDENTLRFDTPDAASPAKMEGQYDRRNLAVAVRSIRLLPPAL